MKTVSLLVRPYLRRLGCYVFYAASKVISRRVSLCGSFCYQKQIKSSDTLFVVGPGASILNYSESDFDHIEQFDSIVINYAMLHKFEPTCYLFEPHDTQDKGYFRFLSRKKIENSNAYFLIKGYNSWKKFFLFLRNIKDFSMSGAKNLLLMKDGYLSDYKKTLTCQLSKEERGDFFINHIASIIYCLDLAIEARYQKIVFCGIDVNTDYFYFHEDYLSDREKSNLTRPRHLNKHSKDAQLKTVVLNYLQEAKRSSNIEMFVFKGTRPLRAILKQYQIGDG